MTSSCERDGRTTRRRLLGRTAGMAGGVLAAGLGPGFARAAASPTVVTWNVALGVDVGRLLGAETLADVRTIAGELLDEVDPSTSAARADGIAAGIERTGADVVALQEAAVLRTQRPSDFGTDGSEAAETVVVDLLEEIVSALADRGLDYEVAAATVTTDVELPAETVEGPVDVRVTDRDVLLVRADHDVRDAVTDTYAAVIPFTLSGTDRVFQLRRGFCTADVVVDGVPFTAVSTHLESVTGLVRVQQAAELLDRLPTDGPVVLCGDFNSGPGRRRDTYDRLTAAFTDADATVRPGTPGFTCCQSADLENDRSRLDGRVDAVLYRGGVRPERVTRLGHRPADRVTVERDGTAVRLWPSDHAGVVATLAISESTPRDTSRPTVMPRPTASSRPNSTDGPTRTPTSIPSTTRGRSGPGFGVRPAVVGAIGLCLAGLARMRRSVR